MRLIFSPACGFSLHKPIFAPYSSFYRLLIPTFGPFTLGVPLFQRTRRCASHPKVEGSTKHKNTQAAVATRVLLLLPGDVLRSQEPALSVSSALEVLTVVFGMGTRVSPPPSSPDLRGLHRQSQLSCHRPCTLETGYLLCVAPTAQQLR